MIKTSATVPLQYDTVFSPFYAREFDYALSWLRDNGFDGIEICISEPKKIDADELNKKIKSHDLEVSVISTGQARVLEGISLTDDDENTRSKAVERIKEHIELSTKIGYPLVTIGLIRGIGDMEKKEKHLSYLHDAMEKCVEYARLNDVRLIIEPINRYETILLNSVEETMDFMSSISRTDNLGILLDTFHSNIEDQYICSTIENLGNKLFHVHFADSNRRLPGMGHMDFMSIYKSLNKINYNGYVSLETLNLPDRKIIKDNAFKSLTKYMP